jgi:GLEYA domain
MAANGISTLSTKEARQKAKLDLAQTKRQAGGDTTKPYYRINNTYDITALPTQYVGNTVYNNPNTNGLLQGRPWVDIEGISFSPNIYFYNRVGINGTNGYFNENVNFFDNAVVSPVTQTVGTVSTINISSQPQYNSILYIGYLKAPSTETYTFYTSSDDASYLWLGPTAVSGFSTTNALVKNGGLHAVREASGTINLIQNIYYPMRILFGNNTGPGTLIVSYSTPTITKTSNWTNLLFYNSATNGF